MKFKIGDLVTISEANYYKYFERFETDNLNNGMFLDLFEAINQKLIVRKIIITESNIFYLVSYEDTNEILKTPGQTEKGMLFIEQELNFYKETE